MICPPSSPSSRPIRVLAFAVAAVALGFNPDPLSAQDASTRDPQTGSIDVLTYEDMVRAGRALGPRIYSTGPGVFSSENIRDLDHARDVLRRYSDYYDTKTIKMYGAGNREQRQWIIQAARELEIMPTTEGGLDYEENLTMRTAGPFYWEAEANVPTPASGIGR